MAAPAWTCCLTARKSDGKEAKLIYNGDLLLENLNGLIAIQVNGTAARDADCSCWSRSSASIW